jgi:hypothetical protein
VKPTEFKIGELVKYPVYDDGGGETCLAVGIVVDLTKEDMSDLPSYMKAEIGEDALMYKILGGVTEGDGWYYPWEILKFDATYE